MEYVEGKRLKTVLLERTSREQGSTLWATSSGAASRSSTPQGSCTATSRPRTSLSTADGVSLIDFGLAIHSLRFEDHAVDLRLIKETLTGAHHWRLEAIHAIAPFGLLFGAREGEGGGGDEEAR